MAEQYFDIDGSGAEDSAGNPVTYFDKYAIQQAILKYLSSDAGDYLMLPEMGGITETLLFTNMTPAVGEEIENTLRSALRDNFSDAISNIRVVSNPILETEVWEITISFMDKLNDNQISTLVITMEDTESTQDKFTKFIDLESTGDNLIEDIIYIKANIAGMTDKILAYNFTEGLFFWGQYRLTNFSSASPNFSEVLALING